MIQSLFSSFFAFASIASIAILNSPLSHAAPAPTSCSTLEAPMVRLKGTDQHIQGYRLCPETNDYGFQQQVYAGIRYAQAPIGDKRFKRPVKLILSPQNDPLSSLSTISSSSLPSPLSSSSSSNEVTPLTFGGPVSLMHAKDLNGKTIQGQVSAANVYPQSCALSTSNSITPTSEDCLGLTVIRPDNDPHPAPSSSDSGSGSGSGLGLEKLPVMVWIYGGGFLGGSSSSLYYNGSFIVQLSQKLSKPILFVSINYRTSVFGFPVGASADGEDENGNGNNDGEEELRKGNLGLYDQRLALHWIREHIDQFGGDRDKITLVGESAGATSVLHHLTAYDGKDPKEGDEARLFGRVISQSPYEDAWPDTKWSKEARKRTWKGFMKACECDSIDCLRKVPFEKMVNASNTVSGWQPQQDDEIVTLPLGAALRQGRFSKGREVIIGGTTDEGTMFAPKGLTSMDELKKSLLTVKLLDDLSYVPPNGLVQDILPHNATLLQDETAALTILTPRMGEEEGLKKLVGYYTSDNINATTSPYNYPNIPDLSAIDRLSNSIFGDLALVGAQRSFAKSLAKGTKVFKYRFDQLSLSNPLTHLSSGVSHFSDIPFAPFFYVKEKPKKQIKTVDPNDDKAQELALEMASRWLSFVYFDKEPNQAFCNFTEGSQVPLLLNKIDKIKSCQFHNRHPIWPAYQEKGGENIVFHRGNSSRNQTTIVERDEFRKKQLEFVDYLYSYGPPDMQGR